MNQFNRITFDNIIMGGRACIRGLRITIALVLNLIANGMTAKEIFKEYPYLEEEDIHQALQYAAWWQMKASKFWSRRRYEIPCASPPRTPVHRTFFEVAKSLASAKPNTPTKKAPVQGLL